MLKNLFAFVMLLAFARWTPCQQVLYDLNPSLDSNELLYWSWGQAGNETGELFQLTSSNSTLTGFDVDEAVYADGSQDHNWVSDVHLLVTVFTGYQLTYNGNGSEPEFSDPAESVVYNLPIYFQNGTLRSFAGTATNPYFTLPTPVSVTGNLVGIQFTWLGLESGSYEPIPIQIPFGAEYAPEVGNNGFMRGGYQQEFVAEYGTDSSTSLLQNQSAGSSFDNLDVTLYGSAAPEPLSLAILGFGVFALDRGRRSGSGVRRTERNA